MTYSKTNRWLTTVGLAAMSGMRSISGPALLSRFLATRRAGESLSTPATYLNDPLVADGLTLLAVGELVADKLPFVPNRIDPMPLFGRGVFGGFASVSLASVQGFNRVYAGLLGFGAAIASAFTFYHIRRALVHQTKLPDWVFALGEDVLVMLSGLAILHSLTEHEVEKRIS